MLLSILCSLLLLLLLVLIEFISYYTINVSLGLRLAANVLSVFTYNIVSSGLIYFFLALLPLAFIVFSCVIVSVKLCYNFYTSIGYFFDNFLPVIFNSHKSNHTFPPAQQITIALVYFSNKP